ncbi:MAG: thiaminase II, partial [Chloroflexi bacterium]|nr:thiaminase II [Chloroflexota bacterium]
MSFCDEIERESQAQREAMAFHPFVKGIGDGTLPLDRFRHFITQDYVYLVDFARCLALAAAKAPDLETMSWFARSVDYILNTEMELHRSYCAQFGITEAELDATVHAPTCYSYTSYLLRVAHQGSFGELVAALLP